MTDYDAAFRRAATAPMKLSAAESFEDYARRVWPTRAETGLPAEPLARYLYSLASVHPNAEDPA